MNLIQLEYFSAVAQTGSFSAAAKKLFVSQPALSKQIRLLEEELGARLFIRLPRGVCPTREGIRLQLRATEIMRSIRNIPAEIHDLKHSVSGELNIVCGQYLSRKIMPDLLKRLLQRYPGIRPRIRETPTHQHVQALLNGTADIGIGSFTSQETSLICHPIFRSELVLIRSARSRHAGSRKLTKKQIASQNLICHPQGSVMHSIVRRILHPYTPNIFMDSQSSSTIIELVRENFGMAFVPDYLIAPEQRSGIVIGGFDTHEQLTVTYHYAPERPLTPQARAFAEVIREKFHLEEE